MGVIPSERGITTPGDNHVSRPLLTRRGFLGLSEAAAVTVFAGDKLGLLGSFLGGTEYFESGQQIASLEIIPDSVQIVSNGRRGYQLDFLSRRNDLQQNSINHFPRASRVSIPTMNRDAAIALGKYVKTVALVDKELQVASQSQDLGTALIILGGNFNLSRGGKLATVGVGLAALALGAARCAQLGRSIGDAYNPVTTTPEGVNGLATVIAVASKTPTPEATITAVPEIPSSFSGVRINESYLLGNETKQGQGDLLRQSVEKPDPSSDPAPTPVPPSSESSPATVEEMVNYTQKVFRIKKFDYKNPIHLLAFVLAQGTRQGTVNGATYFQEGLNGKPAAFAGLSLYREQLEMGEDVTEYTIQEGIPAGLVLRKGAGITVLGREKDGNIVIAFEEYFDPRGEKNFFEPRMRFAAITPAEFGRISQKFLPNMKYYVGQPNEFKYNDSHSKSKRTVILNEITPSIMSQIAAETRDSWVDVFPKTLNEDGGVKEWEPHPVPAVRRPDTNLDKDLPEDFDPEKAKFKYDIHYNYMDLGDPRSAIVFATDEHTNTVIVARYDGKEWVWREPGMRDYADALSFGNGFAVTNEWFDEWNEDVSPELHQKFRDIIKDYCNHATIHVGLDWGSLESERGVENSGGIDYVNRQIDALRKLGVDKIRGQALIQPGLIPDWLDDLARDGQRKVSNGEITKDELRQQFIDLVKRRVTSIVGRWKGKINEWTVGTEIYNSDDFFLNIIGEEYIDIACKTVRSIDSNAKIIIEDTYNHARYAPRDSIWNAEQGMNILKTRKIVDRLKPKGLLDGIGLEMHLDASRPPEIGDVVEVMKYYGVPIDVTSVDVNVRNFSGSREEKLLRQAQVYADTLEASLQSGICKSFSLWDPGDGFTYPEHPYYGGPNGGSPIADPSPWDENLDPKPAYYAMLNIYRRYLGLPEEPLS